MHVRAGQIQQNLKEESFLDISYKYLPANEEAKMKCTCAMVKKRNYMIWLHLKVLWHSKDNAARFIERVKKERKTE